MNGYNQNNSSAPHSAEETLYGKIESVYCGSGVDGRGLRVVVFFAGCNLRCPFCHNPETLYRAGTDISLNDLLAKIMRYKPYLKRGGVTLSGGEPFLQADFALALMRALKDRGIPTCIETNGHLVNEPLMQEAEYLIVDVKNQEGESLSVYREFLSVCDRLGVRVELTNVLVPEKNDSESVLLDLRSLISYRSVAEGVHFLPFRKLCLDKYANMQKKFAYENIRECETEDVKRAERIVFNR